MTVPSFRFAAGAVLVAGLLTVPLPNAAQAAAPAPAPDPGAAEPANYDSRTGLVAAARPGSARARTLAKADDLRDQLGVQGIVAIDPATGTPRQVARLDGFLTGASTAAPADVALGYVRAHSDVFGALNGLSLRKDYVDADGTHHLSFTQSVGGVPVFGNGLKAHVTKDGRLIQVDGSPLAGLPSGAGTAKLSAAQARKAAVEDVAGDSTAAVTSSAARSATFTDGGNARQVLFNTATGPRLAWQTLTMDEGFLHVVDAAGGKVLYRRSIVQHDTATVWENYPGAPVGGTQEPVNLTKWLPVGAKTLDGDVAHVYSDVNDNNRADATEEVGPSGTRSFAYPFTDFTSQVGAPCRAGYPCSWNPSVANSWQTNRAQQAAQLYAFLGTWHDHLRNKPIGFTSAAGNFEAAGGDAVQGQSLDGANLVNGLPDSRHVNNANMFTPPDGTPPVMQMYLFRGSGVVPGNSGDSADVVYHEYTHGLSNRLVVDANGVSTLDEDQPGAMGEAWSDWYAMDYLIDRGLEQDTSTVGDVRVGKYLTGGGTIRSEPLDCTVGAAATACPGTAKAGSGGYTYGDYGKIYRLGAEVHADGEIWAQTLWDLRKEIGSPKAQSLVTRAMELSPSNPTFLDERNAILQADLVVNGGKLQKKIWSVFAARGMGFFAAALSGADTQPAEDFSTPPPAGTPLGTLRGTVTDSETGKPVAGIRVAFGGHASGFGGDYAATTAADGTYQISGIVPGTYAKVAAQGSGYDPQSRTVSVNSSGSTADWRVRRDWAALAGGSEIVSVTGPDYSDYGCGPDGLLDQSQGRGWGSEVAPGGQAFVFRLPATVDITEFVVNPGATCGDDVTAGTGKYRVETSPDNAAWTVAAEGQFPAGTVAPVTVPLTAGTAGVEYVRYTALTSQAQDAGQCPTGTEPYSGCLYLDNTEVAVYGSPQD